MKTVDVTKDSSALVYFYEPYTCILFPKVNDNILSYGTCR